MTQLTILTASEQRIFDQPPVLNNDERHLYFNVTPDVRLALTRIETPSNKAGLYLVRFCQESLLPKTQVLQSK